MGEAEPPVTEGEVLEVDIDDLGEQGDGIARVDQGFVIFVAGGNPGDAVTIHVTNVADTYAFGEIITDADERNNRLRSTG